MNGQDPDAGELFAEEIASRLRKHLKKWHMSIVRSSNGDDDPSPYYGIWGTHKNRDVYQQFQIEIIPEDVIKRVDKGSRWILYTSDDLKAASLSQIVERIIASGCTKDVQPL